MPKLELTDPFCRNAKPIAGQQTDYYDTTVKGLCLRVSPAGTKTWNLIYSKPGARTRQRMKLGTYPDIPLGTERGARQKAKDQRASIHDGRDPIAEKRARLASMTVADLVENYIARRASSRRSVDEIARRLRKNVSGRDAAGEKIEKRSDGCIGDMKLAELHRRDITKVIDAVKDRGAAVEANRVFEDLRAMVRWAQARGDLDQNLTEGMQKPTETVARERWLTADEIKTMWAALPAADMRESTRRILRLCLVTGQRVGEVAGMMRSELDLKTKIWTIPGDRTKNGREHSVHISDLAALVIRDQMADAKALAERKGRALPHFIFPAPGARAAVTPASVPKAVNRQTILRRGVATVLGVAPWTPHDLRRTAATHMEELGISPFIIGHVLNHVSETKASVTSRVYARYDYSKEKREALDLWAARLTDLVNT